MTFIDPNTGRPFGNHGTADDALEYAFNVIEDWGKIPDFLACWMDGEAHDLWGEFYDWLAEKEMCGD